MGSIQEKLDYTAETKELIRQALISKGAEVAEDEPFRNYVNKLNDLKVGGVDRLQWKCDNIGVLDSEFKNYLGSDLASVLKGLDTTNVTSMAHTFQGCDGVEEIDISDWNTENVVKINDIFAYTENLKRIKFGTSLNSVTNMSYVFYESQGIEEFDFSSYEAPQVTDMNYMCKNCKNLKKAGLPKSTSSLTTMESVFSTCESLEEVNLSGLDTTNVTNMKYMFQMCKVLPSVDMSNLDFSKVTNMYSMFSNCNVLAEIIAPNFKNAKPTNIQLAFNSCKKLTSSPKINMVNVTSSSNASNTFSNCSNIVDIYVYNVRVSFAIGASSGGWGTKTSDFTLFNTSYECWDLTGQTSQTLEMPSTRKQRMKEIYVKLIETTDEMRAEDPYVDNKKPCVMCESTDEGAITLEEYLISKNWGIK